MASGWQTAKLGDLATFQTGKLDSNASAPNGDYPFFTCSEETLRTNTYSFDTECVLLAGNNANGIFPLKYFRGKFDAYQRTYVVRPRDPDMLITRFLYYALRPKLSEFRSFSTGAATKFLTLTILNQTEILVPPLPLQRRIVGILSAYDDLINNNLRRIKILEEIARSLFREWFIEFRHPGHERGDTVRSTIGKVPKGWEVLPVTDCVQVNPRVVIPRDDVKPFVPMTSLANDSMLIRDIQTRSGNSGAKFQNGDTLFARITPCLENGKTGYVQFLPNASSVAFGSTEFIVLRSKSLSPEFVYLLARSREFRENAIKSMTGASGRQRVQEACFNGFKVAVPPGELLKRFSESVRPMFRLIHQLHLASKNLRATRDLLLPRLLSGALILPVAETSA